jgi:hypothetical protein
MAGPGGFIAQALFEGFWARVALVAFIVVFAPVVVIFVMRRMKAEKRAMQDLNVMSLHSPSFSWVAISERATDCIQRVHAAWSKDDVHKASEWMTSWFWQNQKLVHLEKWDRAGQVNICNLKGIKSISPLLFEHRNDGGVHEGSRLVLAVGAEVQDYLQDQRSGKIVEGSAKFDSVFTVWTFVLAKGTWLVSNIEPGTGGAYLKAARLVPPIEATILKPQAM